jgi:hypothetical protein
MPAISLDTADAIELAELLTFIGGWLTPDPDSPGWPATGVAEEALEAFEEGDCLSVVAFAEGLRW